MILKKVMALVGSLVLMTSAISCQNSDTEGTSNNVANDAGDEKQINQTIDNNGVVNYEASNPSKCPTEALNRTDSAVIAVGEFCEKFMPLYCDNAFDQYVLNSMYEPLLNLNERGEVDQGKLAELPEISEDKLTYTFKLKDASWSDGTPITSNDVELAVRMFCDPSYNGTIDFLGAINIAGGKEYREGDAQTVTGFEKVDDKTFKITLTEPNSEAEYGFADLTPVPAHYYSQYYEKGTDKITQAFTTPGPSSGAYKYSSYSKGDEFVVETNDKYYGEKSSVNKIIFKYIPEETRVTSVEKGEADIALEVVPTDDIVDEIRDSEFISYKMFPENGYKFIGMDVTSPGLNEKEVRQALTYGLNRKKVADAIYGQYGKVINIPQSQASWTYSAPEEEYEYNLEKAKQILDSAGWTMGPGNVREKNGEKLSVHLTAASGREDTNALIAVAENDYKELGIDFTYEVISFSDLVNKLQNRELQAWNLGWQLSSNPSCEDLFAANGPSNFGKYENPELEEMFKELRNEFDKEKQKEIYKKIYSIINEDCPFVFMIQRNSTTVYNSRIQGLSDSPFKSCTKKLNEISIK